MMNLKQLTLLDIPNMVETIKKEAKTDVVNEDPDSKIIRVVEGDVIKPNLEVYGQKNRDILRLLDSSSFLRDKAIREFEGLGIEIRSETGLSGLHEARKGNLAQFFTPLEFCRLIISILQIQHTATVLDNSCGIGRMAWFLSNKKLFTGIEIEYYAYQIAKKIYPNSQIYNGSLLSFEIPEESFDYVLLNPPFNLPLYSRDGSMIHINWEGKILSHIASLEIGVRALRKGGFLAAILPRNVWKLESTRKFHEWFLASMTEILRIHLPKESFAGTDWPCTLFIFQKEEMWCKHYEYTLKHLAQTKDVLLWWKKQKRGEHLWTEIIAKYAFNCSSTEPVFLKPKTGSQQIDISTKPKQILPLTETDEVKVTCVKGKLKISPNGLISALKLANIRANFREKEFDYTKKRYFDLFKQKCRLDCVWSGEKSLDELKVIQLLHRYELRVKYTEALQNWLRKKKQWYFRHLVPFEQWINARPKKKISADTEAELFQKIQEGDLLRAKKTEGRKGDYRDYLRIVKGKEYSVLKVSKDHENGNIDSIVAMTETGEKTWWASAYEKRKNEGYYYHQPDKIFDYFYLYCYSSKKSDWKEINVDKGFRATLAKLYNQQSKQLDSLCDKYPFLNELYDFQRDDVIRLSLKDCVIDASEQGLGKTRKAIAVALLKGVKRALFIVPPHLKKNWLDECKEINIPISVISSDSDVFLAKRQKIRKDEPPKFYLITFTTLKKVYKRGGIETKKTIADVLKKRFPFIAVDECHALSNKLTKITKAIKTLRAKHKHFMSGTPIGNTVKNIWSIFDILYKSQTPLFPHTTSAFREQFVSVEWVTKEFDSTLSSGRTAQQIPDVLDVKGFTELIEGKILRRVKDEPVVRRDVEIPKPHIIEIEVVPSKEQLIHYKAHLEKFAELFKKYLRYDELKEHKVDTSVVLAHIQHLQFCATIPQHKKVNLEDDFAYRGGLTTSQKKVISLIKEHRKQGEKILLFTQRPDYCVLMKHRLKENRIESQIFTGKVSIDKRNKQLEAFRRGKLQVLLASIRVTDTGLNIPEANVAIIVEPSWKYSEIEQAFSRILRPQTVGQPKVYLIRNKGLIDMYLWQHCVEKRKANAEVIDYRENDRSGKWTHWKDFIMAMLKEEGLLD